MWTYLDKYIWHKRYICSPKHTSTETRLAHFISQQPATTLFFSMKEKIDYLFRTFFFRNCEVPFRFFFSLHEWRKRVFFSVILGEQLVHGSLVIKIDLLFWTTLQSKLSFLDVDRNYTFLLFCLQHTFLLFFLQHTFLLLFTST